MNRIPAAVCLLAACLAWSPALIAQTAGPEERLRSALRDTTRKLHEAQDELAAVRAELETLRQKAATPPKACPPVPEISARARRQIEQLSADNAALRKYAEEAQAMIAKWQEAQNQWQAGLQQANQQAQTNEVAARTAQEQLQQTQQQAADRYQDCLAKNGKLVGITNELLQQYEDKGLWDVIIDAEPITQIPQVELQTLIQEYSGRIEDNQVNVEKVEHGK